MSPAFETIRGRQRGQLAADIPDVAGEALPDRVHAVVLVARLHKPTLHALALAKATRPSTLQAVSVETNEEDTRSLVNAWADRGLTIPLAVLEWPHRDVTEPVLEYVTRMHRDNPRDLVSVFLPGYIAKGNRRLLHNRSASRLKRRLLSIPGVMVTVVPWQAKLPG